MQRPAQVRITVLRRTVNRDFQERFLVGDLWPACQVFTEGQSFLSTGWMPEGFCSFAWADIVEYVLTLARGGNMLGVRPGAFVTCCTDGFRPVFFALERIEEGGEAAG
jgi:uncharacterized repeat protein (TIGR04076 family)